MRVGAALRARGMRSILLVSDPLHLVRARAAFEREGLDVLPAPTETPLDARLPTADRLALARASFRGSRVALLPPGGIRVSRARGRGEARARCAHLSLVVVLALTSSAGYLMGAAPRWGSRARGSGARRPRRSRRSASASCSSRRTSRWPCCRSWPRARWGGRFVSVYQIDDVTIAAVSLLQGLVFRWWRERRLTRQRQSSRTKSSSRS